GPRSTMSMMMETMPAPRSHRPAGSSDRRGPGRPRYEAERVPGRVGVDAPAALPAGQPAGAPRPPPRVGGIDALDQDVEMHLLRPAGVGPPRRLEAGRQLDPDARGPVVRRDDREAVFLPGDREAEKLGVERRERRRVGTVHDHVVEASDHGAILAPG